MPLSALTCSLRYLHPKDRAQRKEIRWLLLYVHIGLSVGVGMTLMVTVAQRERRAET